jgi:hypothetical protein
MYNVPINIFILNLEYAQTNSQSDRKVVAGD